MRNKTLFIAAYTAIAVVFAVFSWLVWLRWRVRADWGYEHVQADPYVTELHQRHLSRPGG